MSQIACEGCTEFFHSLSDDKQGTLHFDDNERYHVWKYTYGAHLFEWRTPRNTDSPVWSLRSKTSNVKQDLWDFIHTLDSNKIGVLGVVNNERPGGGGMIIGHTLTNSLHSSGKQWKGQTQIHKNITQFLLGVPTMCQRHRVDAKNGM